ncbi:cytochrome d ubiquinol oxidase, subunit II [Lysobacter enzymogenes]|uniref:Cytochrome d ubiquinol oxidase, subunit II n=1 Tax=Lysobacter enzymogenes TaxID=69 RepID=A0A0S2DBV1_LYSEN|nr:cytochrome d ubiquinol oxidase subunit II [Lysobacter enzymogenes]ALN55998.1 cytochrome d ubiquinol oxidase, subunit II [Lysobacter enzymogenes]QCW24941.1 cytochrome d ubiquinol oxidase subunit II [Lysobacter enzymogenes]
MIDYALLRELWWLLLGVLLIGFALTDGYDLGLGAILRLIGRDDVERRMALEAIEPNWEGNQVWFILGGGAVFAAWPLLYAASFSALYFAMFLLLVALILRPVGFAFRNRLPHARWRGAWDWALTIAGAVPSLVFGVAFGNLFLGVPFHFTEQLLPVFDGSFLGLFHPFALLAGVVSLAMLVMHGASYAAMRVEDPVGARARRIARIAAAATIAAFAGAGAWLRSLPGTAIVGAWNTGAPSDPLAKQAIAVDGGWLANYALQPWLIALPALAFAALLAVALLRSRRWSFIASGVAVACIILTAGASLFPFLMPSATDPAHGLTVWDASSSQRTLGIMLVAAAIFLPLILAYTAWAFRVMRGTITRAHVQAQGEHEGGY